MVVLNIFLDYCQFIRSLYCDQFTYSLFHLTAEIIFVPSALSQVFPAACASLLNCIKPDPFRTPLTQIWLAEVAYISVVETVQLLSL